MRAFIAIDIPKEIKEKISSFRKISDSVRWLAPEQIHLTLNFLGEIDSETCELLKSELEKIHSEKFELELKSSGFFPSDRRPSVFWLGVSESKNLLRLKESIDSAVKSLNLPIETRPFKPHITVARIAKIKPDESAKIAKSTQNFRAKFEVKSFSLFSSELKPEGAVYSRLSEFFLHPAEQG